MPKPSVTKRAIEDLESEFDRNVRRAVQELRPELTDDMDGMSESQMVAMFQRNGDDLKWRQSLLERSPSHYFLLKAAAGETVDPEVLKMAQDLTSR